MFQGHPWCFPRYMGRVQAWKSGHPLFPCLVLWPFFFTKFKYRDNGTHVESDGGFALALKMASDPQIQQLCTANKVSFTLSSTEIQGPNSFDDNGWNMIGLLVDLLYQIDHCRIDISR